jgi:proteasome lid subunit RPN8/RPN11
MSRRRYSQQREQPPPGRPEPCRLLLPAAIWESTVAALRRPPHDRERVAFLDGLRGEGGAGAVTTLTLPEALTSAGHYEVDAAQMSRAGRHLRRFGLVRLAQVHSHPAGWTDHSPEDDEAAFSQRDGAISIVVPDYAGCAPGLADCGVHERGPQEWRRLSPTELAARVLIVPSTIDLRR